MSLNIINLKCAKSDIDYFTIWFNWLFNKILQRNASSKQAKTHK